MAGEGCMRVLALRLKPGEDIVQGLVNLVRQKNISSAFILTCVGSVSRAKLRFATGLDKSHKIVDLMEFMEISSLVGTVSSDGVHLHTTLGRSDGASIVGHVIDSLIVQTTAEIVLGSIEGVTFSRLFDPQTGYRELVIYPSQPDDPQPVLS